MFENFKCEEDGTNRVVYFETAYEAGTACWQRGWTGEEEGEEGE